MKWALRCLLLASCVAVAACGGGGGGGGSGGSGDGGGDGGASTAVLDAGREVVVFAWNDLGMHCLNSTYDKDVILPPFNNLLAQVVRRGNPPQVVTSGVTVHYELLNNTTSYGKRTFGGFWDRMSALFGTTQARDVGLTGNGLSGTMAFNGDHYEATGVPVTPLDDAGTWSPFQVARITVTDATGAVLAETRCTVPISDEINCGKCHKSAATPDAPQDPYVVIHDRNHQSEYVPPGDSLAGKGPFLCASPSCHTSPALGQNQQTHGGSYLSAALHTRHGALDAASRPACYDCHPGAITRCNRSLRHLADDGNCPTCHGSLEDVGRSILQGGRVPWVTEPKCATCHEGSAIPEVDTGTALYRNSVGHGGMRCPSCHGSPHAMVPSREDSDNYQVRQYVGATAKVVTLGSCGACHESSRGEGLGEFADAHGGPAPGVRNACHVCHTAVAVEPTRWPHQFKWNAR